MQAIEIVHKLQETPIWIKIAVSIWTTIVSVIIVHWIRFKFFGGK